MIARTVRRTTIRSIEWVAVIWRGDRQQLRQRRRRRLLCPNELGLSGGALRDAEPERHARRGRPPLLSPSDLGLAGGALRDGETGRRGEGEKRGSPYLRFPPSPRPPV